MGACAPGRSILGRRGAEGADESGRRCVSGGGVDAVCVAGGGLGRAEGRRERGDGEVQIGLAVIDGPRAVGCGLRRVAAARIAVAATAAATADVVSVRGRSSPSVSASAGPSWRPPACRPRAAAAAAVPPAD